MERAELGRLLRGAVGAVAPSGRFGAVGCLPGAPVFIAESDPRRFMSAFASAVGGDSDVFLCDASWGGGERSQLDLLLQSKIENPESKIQEGLGAPKLPKSEGGWLMIPTGGTGGRLKFARHDQDTLSAAVRGFARHFDLERVNALGLLPLHHVSGLMAWMRCALTGGEYRQGDWKTVEQGLLPDLPGKPEGWVVSLVPTQLERLLRSAAAVGWLKKFRIIFLGGGPAWPQLLDRAARAGLPLSPGYGMTETAAMVAAVRPGEFLAGARGCGSALPHSIVSFAEDGTITVGGESVFRGYFPDWRAEAAFVTEDTGRFDERGSLVVLGRRDGTIISGGEKIQPAEVEATLWGTSEFDEVVVVGVADAEWGQVVVAAYSASCRPDLAKVNEALARHLSAYKRPRHFVPLPDWPVTGSGKTNRAEVARRVQAPGAFDRK